MQYNLLSRSYKSSLCFSLWDTLYLYPSEFKNGDLILQVKVRKLSLEDIGLAAWLNLQVALYYKTLIFLLGEFMSTRGLKLLAPMLVALILWFIPAPEGLSSNAWHFLAIFLAIVIGLILENHILHGFIIAIFILNY